MTWLLSVFALSCLNIDLNGNFNYYQILFNDEFNNFKFYVK